MMQTMKQTFSLKEKYKQLLLILIPILITQITMFSMTFFDMVMSGRVSSQDLAGVAIGASIWAPISTGLAGLFIAITPVVSQLIGANRCDRIPNIVIQGAYLAILVSIVLILLGYFLLNPILSLMDWELAVNNIAKGYLTAIAMGIPAFFIYQTFRAFIDALGQTFISMIVVLVSLPINIILSYIFIYGKLGMPALGGIGAGIATALTYWAMTLIAGGIIKYHSLFAQYGVLNKFHPISLSTWLSQLKIGLPIGFAIFFEQSIFSAVTLFMSSFDTVTIAAHQIAMNFSSMFYMIPLSISMALTILVGYEVGAYRFKDAKEYFKIGISTAFMISIISALAIYGFREHIALLYSREIEVIELAKEFIIFAIFFQFSDAIATPTQGVLRGYKDVNITFVLALIAYWVIALPAGFTLANNTALGAFGYWVGLIIGIAFNGTCLITRLKFIQSKYNRQPEVA